VTNSLVAIPEAAIEASTTTICRRQMNSSLRLTGTCTVDTIDLNQDKRSSDELAGIGLWTSMRQGLLTEERMHRELQC
jgi:hypothetical protein